MPRDKPQEKPHTGLTETQRKAGPRGPPARGGAPPTRPSPRSACASVMQGTGEVCETSNMSQIETINQRNDKMDRIENFKALGIKAYGTARDATMGSAIALSLGFIEAYGFTDEPNKAAYEAFKRDAKAALRNRGEDRKTADRHVNRAATISQKVAEKYHGLISDRAAYTEAGLVQAVFVSAKGEGAANIAAFVRLVKGEGVEDPDAVPEKDAEAEAKAAADLAMAENKAATEAEDRIALALSQIETLSFGEDMAMPEKIASPEAVDDGGETDPEAMLDLAKWSDKGLATMLDLIVAEQSRRAVVAELETAAA